MNVPFLDLKAQHQSIRAELDSAIRDVIDSCAFAGGPFVEKFENEFANFCVCRHAIGVGSGTEALWLVLLALGVGPGDEVITVANSFIATAEAISFCGARPVLVDVDQSTYTMDPEELRKAITDKTRAIIPVHLFGQMADMDPIMEVARQGGVPVIEDACQAHGAEYNGRRAGSIGIAGAFSFYPGKNLGACGEAGAVVTNDSEMAQKLRFLRDHGQEKKYFHSEVGWNARMDGLQGAILSVKLQHLEGWNERRRQNASVYNQLLGGIRGVNAPTEAQGNRHIYHVYAIRVPARDSLMAGLKNAGVNCAVHYPVPIHLQKAYECLKLAKGSFPIAERCAEEFLSLPMFPELSREQMGHVAASIAAATNLSATVVRSIAGN
jgi:dTDP-4-amino-4,6-dideoxygalactose transaminase